MQAPSSWGGSECSGQFMSLVDNTITAAASASTTATNATAATATHASVYSPTTLNPAAASLYDAKKISLVTTATSRRGHDGEGRGEGRGTRQVSYRGNIPLPLRLIGP